MTDKDKVIALLVDLGVGFEEEVCEDCIRVECRAGEHSKVEGTCSGLAVFAFDMQGKFCVLGVGEA